jgi:hypothetical protein
MPRGLFFKRIQKMLEQGKQPKTRTGPVTDASTNSKKKVKETITENSWFDIDARPKTKKKEPKV